MAIIGDIDSREQGWRKSFREYIKAERGVPNKLLYIEPEEGWQIYDLEVMHWFLYLPGQEDLVWGKR